jgi:hypothetical protein
MSDRDASGHDAEMVVVGGGPVGMGLAIGLDGVANAAAGGADDPGVRRL